jgi:DNA-binding response OmpR family regulator
MAHILVIDDQPHIRTIIHEILSFDGHQIDLAENGKVALTLIRLRHYDLVITDVIMPELDGLEVIAALKKEFPGTRIIVMSGGSTRIDTKNLLMISKELGADRALAKPLDFTKLQEAVREVLESVGRSCPGE